MYMLHICIYIYIYTTSIYIYIYIHLAWASRAPERARQGLEQLLGVLRGPHPGEGRIKKHYAFGWRYLSRATCLMRPRLFYVCFVLSRIIISRYIIHHC